jgi:Cu(I)/Ag(I) efflux system membrane fusion protein
MKRVSNNKVIKLFAFFLILFIAISGCKEKHTANDIAYTCPMHPDIVKNEASTCPICGMDLVKMHQHDAGKSQTEYLDLTDTLNNRITANVKTISPKIDVFTDTLTLNGRIDLNTNNTKTIASYISGRIEKLYVQYNFQKVVKGQKIMDIYSPDLVAAQQELLYLKEAGDPDLMNKAKRKLYLLGVSEKEINKILHSGKANHRIGIYSQVSGYIIESSLNDSEMLNNSPFSLREGMYVKSGELLFRVYDNGSVWVEFYATAAESNHIQQGLDILIEIAGGKTIQSKITSILPFYKEGQNFMNIRVKLNNAKNDFKVGELATGKIISENKKGLWVPKSAVYHSGSRSIVFLKSGDYLYPKEISASIIGNKVMVLNGITKDDQIAENAAHLIDPEAFIPNINGNEK